MHRNHTWPLFGLSRLSPIRSTNSRMTCLGKRYRLISLVSFRDGLILSRNTLSRLTTRQASSSSSSNNAKASLHFGAVRGLPLKMATQRTDSELIANAQISRGLCEIGPKSSEGLAMRLRFANFSELIVSC